MARVKRSSTWRRTSRWLTIGWATRAIDARVTKLDNGVITEELDNRGFRSNVCRHIHIVHRSRRHQRTEDEPRLDRPTRAGWIPARRRSRRHLVGVAGGHRA